MRQTEVHAIDLIYFPAPGFRSQRSFRCIPTGPVTVWAEGSLDCDQGDALSNDGGHTARIYDYIVESDTAHLPSRCPPKGKRSSDHSISPSKS